MTALQSIERAFLKVGYRAEAVVPNYDFADVLAPVPVTRTAPLVAFARTPPSYRSAALGVLNSNGGDIAELVREHRALGAPFMLVIEGDLVTVWKVRSDGAPQKLEQVSVQDISELFEQHRARWQPDAIHRAKSIERPADPQQLDFIDLGLLPAIEGEIHLKLDRLLVESLDLARQAGGAEIEPRRLFRIVFRLLAAKVLEDRGHPFAAKWQPDNLSSVLATIENYYGLPVVDAEHHAEIALQFAPAWDHLRAGISFSNVSSDDLAFIYENTLITDQTRDLFGTHSTPRQLAEYIVQRIDLHVHAPQDLRIYEPCAGAGVFLVSALRHLRDLLPDSWSDAKRHAFLIERIAGDEIDPFACEVATLSLILADYPNHNGWHIRELDLLEDGALAARMGQHNIILCNPPFEAFKPEEKQRYPQAAQKITKAIAVLSAAIDARPLALGFVLPRAFILEKQFLAQRRRLEALYKTIEIVELPDRIFGVSKVESAALIAKDRNDDEEVSTALISTEINDGDRIDFLTHGRVSGSRRAVRARGSDAGGNLWIPPLDRLWRHLSDAPRLATRLQPRWGLRWNYSQDLAAAPGPREGYRQGLLKVRGFQQYLGGSPVYLDFRAEHLREGYKQDWSRPKLIMNAMRLRRGPWRTGAMVDLDGLLYSQQFFGLWPATDVSEDELFALCAVLNGPIANAFLAVHAPRDRFRSSVVERLPIPSKLPAVLPGLVREYLALVRDGTLLTNWAEELANRLAEIDALTLSAYDLPTDLLVELAQYFGSASRPVGHPFPSTYALDWSASAGDLAARELAQVHAKIKSANAALQQRYYREIAMLAPEHPIVRAWGGSAVLRQWQADRRVFGVGADDVRFPAFQFDAEGPRPVVATLLAALPRGFSAWEVGLWFVASNPWLDGEAPVDLLDAPDRLIRAATEAANELLG